LLVIDFHNRASRFMRSGQRNSFSEAATVFQGKRLPEAATPVGYAALIEVYDLSVPLPLALAAIGPRHKVYEADGWHIYTPRHAPDADLGGHLAFALRYEGLDLAMLKALFRVTGPDHRVGTSGSDRRLCTAALVSLRMAAGGTARSA
jgi:hypothetical protein